MEQNKSWAVICDFDGTIATRDVTDSLLGAFALPEWETVEAAWKNGKIGSRQCMSRQIELLRCAPGELDQHLDAVGIDSNFARFAESCTAAGHMLMIASDGLDYAIGRILDRHGLNNIPIRANRLRHAGDNRFRLEFPNGSPLCAVGNGMCKCAAARECAEGRPILLVGDGASDFCLARAADFVFAKDKLLDFCRREGLPCLAFRNFGDATRLLSELVQTPTKGFVANA